MIPFRAIWLVQFVNGLSISAGGMSHSETLSRLTVGNRRSDMIRWALRKGIDKFERDWNYDASYIHDMIDASPRAAWLVSRVTHLLAAVALIGAFGLAAPAAAQVSDQPPRRQR
jgi:hypothetical protein